MTNKTYKNHFEQKTAETMLKQFVSKESLGASTVWYTSHSTEMFHLHIFMKQTVFANYLSFSVQTIILILAKFGTNMYFVQHICTRNNFVNLLESTLILGNIK